MVGDELLRVKAPFGAWQEELFVCSTLFYFFLFVSPGLVRWGFQFKFRPKGQSYDLEPQWGWSSWGELSVELGEL